MGVLSLRIRAVEERRCSGALTPSLAPFSTKPMMMKGMPMRRNVMITHCGVRIGCHACGVGGGWEGEHVEAHLSKARACVSGTRRLRARAHTDLQSLLVKRGICSTQAGWRRG